MEKIKSQLRQEDEKNADIVSTFLDQKFYNQTSNFRRVYNKKEQCQGIDVTFTYNNEEYICDEKAAIRYINQNLQTFSMELSFYNRHGDLNVGWLLNKENINNSYLFVWIDKAKKDLLTSTDDIQQIQIALVKKEKIKEYLKSLGWSEERLILKSERIRNNPSEYLGNIRYDGIKFSYSKHLVEKPVNILISRDILVKISDKSLTIK